MAPSGLNTAGLNIVALTSNQSRSTCTHSYSLPFPRPQGLSLQLARWNLLAFSSGCAVLTPLMFASRLGKKWSMVLASLIAAVVIPLPESLQLGDKMPDNCTTALFTAYVTIFVIGQMFKEVYIVGGLVLNVDLVDACEVRCKWMRRMYHRHAVKGPHMCKASFVHRNPHTPARFSSHFCFAATPGQASTGGNNGAIVFGTQMLADRLGNGLGEFLTIRVLRSQANLSFPDAALVRWTDPLWQPCLRRLMEWYISLRGSLDVTAVLILAVGYRISRKRHSENVVTVEDSRRSRASQSGLVGGKVIEVTNGINSNGAIEDGDYRT